MSINKKSKPLPDLALAIGDFIRYWGFRRIHGQVWTLVFLSQKPLSGAELAEQLQVSKGLISTAVNELEGHNLIGQIESENGKTKRYVANPEVFKVIKDILLNRELMILQKITSQFEVVQRTARESDEQNLDQDRMKELGQMIGNANNILNAIISVESPQTFAILGSFLGKL